MSLILTFILSLFHMKKYTFNFSLKLFKFQVESPYPGLVTKMESPLFILYRICSDKSGGENIVYWRKYKMDYEKHLTDFVRIKLRAYESTYFHSIFQMKLINLIF